MMLQPLEGLCSSNGFSSFRFDFPLSNDSF
uniref:Uncharacterized protein n=1 Tax=Myoviridae sp. ctOpw2 TaxID=2825093 RepID=A0A8S5UD36_9CAUD|nr:MAG TPA: hypothetical protein [Myoviridae sp. ctOpw2]DAJ05083.1 MAG TPA: hypothetical protein [Caudoviricetes sp.]DAL73916.1 MAG TPA: hypothetical protein [Caudoviricetes sp.]